MQMTLFVTPLRLYNCFPWWDESCASTSLSPSVHINFTPNPLLHRLWYFDNKSPKRMSLSHSVFFFFSSSSIVQPRIYFRTEEFDPLVYFSIFSLHIRLDSNLGNMSVKCEIHFSPVWIITQQLFIKL